MLKSFLKVILGISITLPITMGCSPSTNTNQPLPSKTTKSQALATQDVQTRFSNATSNPTDKSWFANPENYYKTSPLIINKSLSVPILEYHEANYIPGNIATLKPGQFLSEIEWLHRNHFHTINFGQLYAAMYHGYKLPSRPILLTFDDGYESVYFKVYPILEKYHDQATLFIVRNFTHDKPNRTVKFPTLTSSELLEMQSSHLVDIESHTIYHRDLTTLSDSEAKWEIQGSATSLQKIVHHPMAFFCYPDGGYTSKTISFVRDAHYLLAVTQHQGYANLHQGPFALDRISVLDITSLQEFAKKLEPSLRS